MSPPRALLESAAILPLHIDSTMISCLRSCPQKYFQEFILGRRPGKLSIDLHAGGVFSSCLEHIYRMIWEQHVPPKIALDRGIVFFEHAWNDFILERDSPKTKENMWAAIEGYFATYPPLTDHVQPFVDPSSGRATFEFSFAIPLTDPGFPLHPSGSPFIYVGRADLLGIYNGLPCIRDEKTTARLDSRWAEHWNLRSQFLGYLWAARQGGLPRIDTVVVRGVIINKTSIRQIEAIKVYSDMLIARWYEQLRRDLWRLTEMWDNFESGVMSEANPTPIGSSAFDYNLGETCTQYGLCPFMDLCQSSTPEAWASNYQVVRWNPLHRNPIDETSPRVHPGLAGLPTAAKPASDGGGGTNSSELAISPQ